MELLPSAWRTRVRIVGLRIWRADPRALINKFIDARSGRKIVEAARVSAVRVVQVLDAEGAGTVDTSLGHCQVGTLDFEVTTLDRAVEQTLNDVFWSVANTCISRTPGLSRSQTMIASSRTLSGADAISRMETRCVGHAVASGDDAPPQPGRVYGPAFFERVLEEGVGRHVKHYFLGSTPETLEKLQASLRTRFPGLDIVGASSPPFKDLDPNDFADELSKIEEARPHIIWVGLGTPKQDKAGAYLASQYPAVFACVGAAFDSARATCVTFRFGFKMPVSHGYSDSHKSRDDCGGDTPTVMRSSCRSY